MSRSYSLFFAILIVAMASFISAQTTTKTDHQKPQTETKSAEHAAPSKPTTKLEKTTLQQVWDAWSTLKPENAAKFYGKGKEHVFFDIAPLKYNGWDEYEKGAAPMLASWKSLKATVNDDAQVHNSGEWAWSVATVNADIVSKDGKAQSMVMRWTAIWHNHGGANWVIAHEHVSVPLSEPEKK